MKHQKNFFAKNDYITCCLMWVAIERAKNPPVGADYFVKIVFAIF